MTLLYKPTIIVKRLVAQSQGRITYDEFFHEGLNILSGCNGGGKTSIIQLLVYCLGYEGNHWKVEAKRCDVVFAEILINGIALTLRRINRDTGRQPMNICFKLYEEAIKVGEEEWSSYPYNASENKESFSQKVFSLLEMPSAKLTDDGGTITLHQILRLIYSDQSNGAGSIFNDEPFDSAFKREAIGSYLLGLYDDQTYNDKIEINITEKKLDKVIEELKTIRKVIGKTSYSEQFDTIEEIKSSYFQEIANLNRILEETKANILLKYVDEKKTTENQATNLVRIKKELFKRNEKLSQLEFEITDSEDFIAALTDKLKAISDSLKVGEVFKEIKFNVCPNCFGKIDNVTEDCCYLCGKESKSQQKKTNLLRMQNEIGIQLFESKQLLKKKKDLLQKLNSEKKEFLSILRQQINKLAPVIQSLNSTTESSTYDIYRQIGEYEEKIENIKKIESLYTSIIELRNLQQNLQEQLNALKERLSNTNEKYRLRNIEICNTISKHLIYILRSDIGSEYEFKNAETIEFDFAASRVTVNGKISFSESSNVYLNNAFHLALFLTSLEKDYLRIPRFMVLDGIENGGMEESRSRNFQKIIKETLEKNNFAHQLIIATKSIYNELNNDHYIVGQTYTEKNKSISL